MTVRRALAIVSLAVLLCVPAVLAAPPEAPANVQISIEIGRIEGNKKVPVGTYQVTTAAGGESMALNVSTRIPLPVDQPPESTAAATFTYQSVGLSTKLRAVNVEGHRIQITGDLSASILRDAIPSHPSPGGPTVGSLSQNVNVVAKAGKAERLLTVAEPGVGSFYVELTAEPAD